VRMFTSSSPLTSFIKLSRGHSRIILSYGLKTTLRSYTGLQRPGPFSMRLIDGVFVSDLSDRIFNLPQYLTCTTLSWSTKVQAGPKFQAMDWKRLQGFHEGTNLPSPTVFVHLSRLGLHECSRGLCSIGYHQNSQRIS
jgi:hypothetical protein